LSQVPDRDLHQNNRNTRCATIPPWETFFSRATGTWTPSDHSVSAKAADSAFSCSALQLGNRYSAFFDMMDGKIRRGFWNVKAAGLVRPFSLG
jgi:hypothetical protein